MPIGLVARANICYGKDTNRSLDAGEANSGRHSPTLEQPIVANFITVGNHSLPLTYPILDRYADIRRHLRPPHGKGLIGDIDTLIAATALERNLTVVTRDTDFERVPALKVSLLKMLKYLSLQIISIVRTASLYVDINS